MLAYAGQGLNGDEGSHSSGELRGFLGRAVEAISGLAEVYAAAVKQKNLQPTEPYHDYMTVLDTDARARRRICSPSEVCATLAVRLHANTVRPQQSPWRRAAQIFQP